MKRLWSSFIVGHVEIQFSASSTNDYVAVRDKYLYKFRPSLPELVEESRTDTNSAVHKLAFYSNRAVGQLFGDTKIMRH